MAGRQVIRLAAMADNVFIGSEHVIGSGGCK
jgi:hypothetical protein